MKKFVALFLFLCVINFCGTAFADGVKIGVLSNALSENDFKVAYGNVIKWSVFDKGHGENDSLHFYENFSSMLMALNAGEINEIRLPKAVGEYVLNTNPDYKISCVSRTNQANFVFGFLKGEGIIHQNNFNYALRQMKKNGSLDALKRLYFIDAVKNDNKQTLSLSYTINDKYDLKNLALSIPCTIGKNGIENVHVYDINDNEKEMFFKSAKKIRNTLEAIEKGDFNL